VNLLLLYVFPRIFLLNNADVQLLCLDLEQNLEDHSKDLDLACLTQYPDRSLCVCFTLPASMSDPRHACPVLVFWEIWHLYGVGAGE